MTSLLSSFRSRRAASTGLTDSPLLCHKVKDEEECESQSVGGEVTVEAYIASINHSKWENPYRCPSDDKKRNKEERKALMSLTPRQSSLMSV
jgi:hypothetical protein